MNARRAALAIAAVGVAIVVGVVGTVSATIEGGTFTSKDHNVRATVPRGWRVTDQPTYPGVVLRMYRTKPRASILLSVDTVPVISAQCQSPGGVAQPLAIQVACEQSRELAARGFTVEALKETARPWFNYDDGTRHLRQGVAIVSTADGDDQVATLVLAADTAAGRAQYKSTFDKVLRSVRDLGSAVAATSDASVPHD